MKQLALVFFSLLFVTNVAAADHAVFIDICLDGFADAPKTGYVAKVHGLKKDMVSVDILSMKNAYTCVVNTETYELLSKSKVERQ